MHLFKCVLVAASVDGSPANHLWGGLCSYYAQDFRDQVRTDFIGGVGHAHETSMAIMAVSSTFRSCEGVDTEVTEVKKSSRDLKV